MGKEKIANETNETNETRENTYNDNGALALAILGGMVVTGFSLLLGGDTTVTVLLCSISYIVVYFIARHR